MVTHGITILRLRKRRVRERDTTPLHYVTKETLWHADNIQREKYKKRFVVVLY